MNKKWALALLLGVVVVAGFATYAVAAPSPSICGTSYPCPTQN